MQSLPSNMLEFAFSVKRESSALVSFHLFFRYQIDFKFVFVSAF